MFIVDKEKLKRKMEEFINQAHIENMPYINNSNSYWGYEFREEEERAKLQLRYEHEQTRKHIEIYVKPLISSIVNELINYLYSNDDFEKDIGLK